MVMLLISVFSAVFRTRYGSGVKPSIAETAKEYIAIIIPTWQIRFMSHVQYSYACRSF